MAARIPRGQTEETEVGKGGREGREMGRAFGQIPQSGGDAFHSWGRVCVSVIHDKHFFPWTAKSCFLSQSSHLPGGEKGPGLEARSIF